MTRAHTLTGPEWVAICGLATELGELARQRGCTLKDITTLSPRHKTMLRTPAVTRITEATLLCMIDSPKLGYYEAGKTHVASIVSDLIARFPDAVIL